jgi:hypothetical protein
MMDRWSLPGPAAFLDALVNRLRQGSSVVIGCPKPMALALSTAVDDRLRQEGWPISGPVAANTPRAPQDALFEDLDLHREGAFRRNAAAVLGALPAGRVVLVQWVGQEQIALWNRFLIEYESASRGVATFDRPLLLVVCAGVPIAALPGNAAALSCLAWRGVVGELDAFTYALQCLRERGRAIDAKQKMLARMICRLALWDFDLADHLLAQDVRVLFDPVQAVNGASSQFDGLAARPPSWEEGSLESFDGEELTHACVVGSSGDPQHELEMRLWAAQAAELLPTLELNRRWLTRRMRQSGLRVPLKLGEEFVTDLDDLEYGSLSYLARTKRMSPDIVRLTEKWRRHRNKLAHLQPLGADDALEEELFRSALQREG